MMVFNDTCYSTQNIYQRREAEMEGLLAAIKKTQKENENLRLYGTLDTPEERRHLSAVDGLPQETVARLDKWATQFPYKVELSEEGQNLQKIDLGLQPSSDMKPELVTELHTAHYQWTEEGGIVELQTIDEELAELKSIAMQQASDILKDGIGRTISDILTPFASQEEAAKVLYEQQTDRSHVSIDENNHLLQKVGGDYLPGLFGKLANHLNNYLEIFGSGNGYFTELSSALDAVDPERKNSLLGEVRNMLAKVKDGVAINIDSPDFEEEVSAAVREAFRKPEQQDNAFPKDKTAKAKQADASLSFTELEQRRLQAEGELLKELLGEETDKHQESLADILQEKAARSIEAPDHTIRNLLKKAEQQGTEQTQPTEFIFADEESAQEPSASAEALKTQATIQKQWNELMADKHWLFEPAGSRSEVP